MAPDVVAPLAAVADEPRALDEPPVSAPLELVAFPGEHSAQEPQVVRSEPDAIPFLAAVVDELPA